MPQPGLHGLFALSVLRLRPAPRGFALGLMAGALLPDLDTYPQGVAVVLGMDPARAEALFHRTLTHSLFFAIGVALVLAGSARLRGDRARMAFAGGWLLGSVGLHILPDLLAWFDGVGILWPLWSVNLWASVVLPDPVQNLLRAANFCAFAAYLFLLGKEAQRRGMGERELASLRKEVKVQLGFGALFTPLAFLLPASQYNFLDGAAFLLWAYPRVLWITWRMRSVVEGDGLNGA